MTVTVIRAVLYRCLAGLLLVTEFRVDGGRAVG